MSNNEYKTVRNFCVRKLAQILYECVAYSHEDRALADWRTAEWFVNNNPGIVDVVYDLFMARASALKPPIFDFEVFDKLCGRAVWNAMFQPMEKQLGLSHQDLPRYTHVRFG